MWLMQDNGPGARDSIPSLITYGSVPNGGYNSTFPAQVLSPGCYRAETYGTAFVEFEIKPDNVIVEGAHGP
jgi:hypothetical protein